MPLQQLKILYFPSIFGMILYKWQINDGPVKSLKIATSSLCNLDLFGVRFLDFDILRDHIFVTTKKKL